ncbi:hypothetical protein F3Y22_tig00111027pilonHSYRG00083 [Hibiscus syriacus]|uniref:HXXXD-type acyl-transferase family protein n=1 Tax=Hibiscus syriacus TaxID=106335 RepID=A0A6A2Z6M8_HIBSY|nr:uncharacterized acetyltransferase At3g50280-like [Hibiscus syriacus]KAE8686775.1 hypothetical protein F3Y22_tig00111027pilonHSYRG00083 [Hibiscus syriacus]
MEGVRCISSTLIQASSTHKEENQRVELTPWDLCLLLLGPIQKGLLFEDGEISDGNTFVDSLKVSLSRTLHHFPPLAGRLATVEHDDETVSFYVDCNNAGTLFVHAKADGVTVSDVAESVYVPSIVNSFFPLNGLPNYNGITQPLLGVQVTKLVDGVFVGCTINHSVVDGTSFWHFINSWSEISRGSIRLSKLPIFQRSFAFNFDYPIRIPRPSVGEFREDGIVQPPLLQRVFHFSKKNIAKLKAKANAEVRANNISSLQALLSHLWLFIIRNKRLNPDEDVNFGLMIGARPRLRDLPERYFGNASKVGRITMKAKEVQEQSVGGIALEMNKMIATHTEEELRRDFESWIASPKLATMASLVSNLTAMSSSPWFDVYGNDFGWGRPISVRSGLGNKFDGKLTVFCGVEEGSIDVEACLSAETLEAMANDDEFMDKVTI